MNENIEELMREGKFTDPHQILGLQEVDEQRGVIRLWRPDSKGCQIEVGGKAVEAHQIHEAGLYEYEVPASIKATDYRVFHQNGKIAHDPYAFNRMLGELDIHLVQKGLHYELYDLLGATIKVHDGVMGTQFALWAPNARSVALIGDFNHWDGRVNPMRSVSDTGVWEIFLPGLGEGEKYKFEILTHSGEKKIKTDPVAHYSELRPKTASVVFDISRFHWSDADWFEERKKYATKDKPINIYEVHPGSWQREGGRFLNYREMGKRLADYCKEMGYTHVELMGIAEHPLDESWGYQVTGYFSSTSRYGTPEDFQHLVNYLHEHHIGVILDWVPAHFPTDAHSLAQFDGTYLYEHIDPKQGYHPHWNTHIFNFGRWEVSNFLIASALYWFEKMHIDGLRVDAVASMLYLDYGRAPGEWVPNVHGTNINLEALEYVKHMNSIVHERFPNVLMIAEESTAFPGITKEVAQDGLGFDLKWNLGWMNDTLSYFSRPFSERKGNLSSLTFVFEYIFNEDYVLVLSHDEVVHEKKSLIEKMPGNEKEKFSGIRLLLSFMMALPGKKLLFMGGELGQRTEWNCKEALPWSLLEKEPNQKLQNMVKALNNFYLENEALSADTQETLKPLFTDEENGVMGYLRKGQMQTLLVLHHTLPGDLDHYHLPIEGKLKEVFNTDREEWGGSGILNGNIEGDTIVIPSLATLIFEVEP